MRGIRRDNKERGFMEREDNCKKRLAKDDATNEQANLGLATTITKKKTSGGEGEEGKRRYDRVK